MTKEEFYAKATAKLLKEECARRDLKVTGTKAELVERLRNADAGMLKQYRMRGRHRSPSRRSML